MKNAEYEQLAFPDDVLKILKAYSDYELGKASLKVNCSTLEEYEKREKELAAKLSL